MKKKMLISLICAAVLAVCIAVLLLARCTPAPVLDGNKVTNSTEKTEEQLVGDVADYAAETASAEVGGLTLQGYGMKDGAVVSWSDGACAMTLTAEKGVALADAMAVAGEIVEANNE